MITVTLLSCILTLPTICILASSVNAPTAYFWQPTFFGRHLTNQRLELISLMLTPLMHHGSSRKPYAVESLHRLKKTVVDIANRDKEAVKNPLVTWFWFFSHRVSYVLAFVVTSVALCLSKLLLLVSNGLLVLDAILLSPFTVLADYYRLPYVVQSSFTQYGKFFRHLCARVNTAYFLLLWVISILATMVSTQQTVKQQERY